MPKVRFLDKVTLVTKYDTPVTITTDPYPLGGQNYGALMANVEIVDVTGGAPDLQLLCEVSNDGRNFDTYGDLQPGVLTSGLNQLNAAVPFAFVRFEVYLNCTGGSPGDMVWATLDLHVNFTHS